MARSNVGELEREVVCRQQVDQGEQREEYGISPVKRSINIRNKPRSIDRSMLEQ